MTDKQGNPVITITYATLTTPKAESGKKPWVIVEYHLPSDKPKPGEFGAKTLTAFLPADQWPSIKGTGLYSAIFTQEVRDGKLQAVLSSVAQVGPDQLQKAS